MDEFKLLYKKEIIDGKGSMSVELQLLFDDLLQNEFGGDHNKMDDLIAKLNYQPSELDVLKEENETLKNRAGMSESAILELVDIILGGM